MVLGPSYAYNEDVKAYLSYLKAGLKAFEEYQSQEKFKNR
jgi:hypothetical protein